MAEILHRLNIAASPETVFDAIATADGIRQWWTDDSECASSAGDVSVFRFMNGEVVFRMRVDEHVPGRRLAWTCLGDYDEWNGTTITWTFGVPPPANSRAYPARMTSASWARLLTSQGSASATRLSLATSSK